MLERKWSRYKVQISAHYRRHGQWRWRRLRVRDIGVGGLCGELRGNGIHRGDHIEVKVDGNAYRFLALVVESLPLEGRIARKTQLHITFVGDPMEVEPEAFALIYRLSCDQLLLCPSDLRRLRRESLQ
jgi:hypothetical protein